MKVTKPEPVDPPPGRDLGVVHLGQGDDHGHHPDRDVEEEDPPPADARGDGPAHERADRHRPTDHRAVDADGRAPLFAGEGLGDEGERGGEHDGAAHTLGGPGQVEHQRRGGQAAGQGGQGEEHEADGEHAPPAVHVTEDTGREQEGGQGQGVGVDHPLEVLEGRVQGDLDVGQRDVHDRDVEQQHERAEADGDEGPPFAVHEALLSSVRRLPHRRGRHRPRPCRACIDHGGARQRTGRAGPRTAAAPADGPGQTDP